ncbi:chloride intracellular channel protein 5-like isoform X1 [Anneissia japonica]|uniref:chloride intracellular channel protein 5-like isoform X1 n=2 Tax=Anneissia japonica TaxID=1529436 RepID=UPI001425A99C|nr:chloride intracellular channel protein 5-like isoform X1 [Anneissia japonica]
MADKIEEQEGVHLFVRAGINGRDLGDCPLCQRIHMILVLKKVEYYVHTVDTKKKTPEYRNISGGKPPPMICDVYGGNVVTKQDVAKIADYLEQTIREPSLACENEGANKAGIDLFRVFAGYMKNQDKTKDEALKAKLTEELRSLDKFLKSEASPGCYLDGDIMKQPDCNLLPKLHHVKVAGQILKSFDIPTEFDAVHEYLNTWYATEVYEKTQYPDAEVEYGWKHTRLVH